MSILLRYLVHTLVFLEVAGGLRERVEVVCGAFFVFVSTLLRYVVHTLFFCLVAGRLRRRVAVVCAALLVFVSTKLSYFRTYPFLN